MRKQSGKNSIFRLYNQCIYAITGYVNHSQGEIPVRQKYLLILSIIFKDDNNGINDRIP